MTDRILAARAAAAHPEDRILADRAGLNPLLSSGAVPPQSSVVTAAEPVPSTDSFVDGEDLDGDALPPIPDMPEEFFPTDMRIIMVEGSISVGLPITQHETLKSVGEKLNQLRLRVWQAMHEAGWQQHEIVADPKTGVRHCRFCHAPEWQTQGKDAVPCVPRTFDAPEEPTDGEVERSEA